MITALPPSPMPEQSAAGPNIEVLMRIFERMLEFEEEVRSGQRVIPDASQPEGVAADAPAGGLA